MVELGFYTTVARAALVSSGLPLMFSILSELDEALLRIIQPIAWNYQNIPQIFLDAWFPKDEPTKH